MKKHIITVPFVFALLFTGCAHLVNFTPPAIPASPAAGTKKSDALIAKVEDKRPAGTEIFVFSNPPHKWTYKCDETVENIVHKLISEGLQRRGIAETTNPSATRRVNAEILDFSGHNDPGVWYVGKCLYQIRCAVKITDPAGDKSFIAAGTATNGIVRLSNENMNVLIDRAYVDFLKSLETELQKAGY
jgi:hypothetical protein